MASATRNSLRGKFMIFCIFVIILGKVIAVVMMPNKATLLKVKIDPDV
jgi:hypothetical protein